MKRKVIILLFIAALAGCHKLDSGIVTRKYFVAAHYKTTVISIISTGKAAVPVLNTSYVPDKWYITVKGEYRGKMRQEDFSISENDFENINIGDFVENLQRGK